MQTNATSLRCAVRVTHLIDQLPAIPTQDWVGQCARALSVIGPHATAISIAANTHQGSDQIEVISLGVATGAQTHPGGSPDSRALAFQDKCERITKLGFTIPESAEERGLVGALQSIDARWQASPIGRTLSNGQLSSPILSCIPIATGEDGLGLINIIAFEKDAPDQAPMEALNILYAVHEILNKRAHEALQRVNNPRAWLTEREHAVLDLLIEGHSVRVIAEKLGRSAHTVHDHVKNLHKKIQASSRGELIAKSLGYVKSPRVGPDPVLMPFPGEQMTEIKPTHVMARPLHP
jgi:DNA-binding CsgD family transcriptional regulator